MNLTKMRHQVARLFDGGLSYRSRPVMRYYGGVWPPQTEYDVNSAYPTYALTGEGKRALKLTYSSMYGKARLQDYSLAELWKRGLA